MTYKKEGYPLFYMSFVMLELPLDPMGQGLVVEFDKLLVLLV